MIECPNCGKRNLDDNKFCGECGTKLPAPQNYCPICDKTYNKEKFCTQCGNKLVNKLEYLQELERLRRNAREAKEKFEEQKRLKEEKKEEQKRLKKERKLKNLKNGYALCNNCGREILESFDICPFCRSENIFRKSNFKY